MRKKQSLICLLLLSLFLPIQNGCGTPKLTPYDRDFFAMDTYITCQVLTADEDLAGQALDAVENAYLEIDRKTNRFTENSEIAAVNANAGIAPVKVSEDLFSMVATAVAWYDKTDGSFNILIGNAMDLWGFGTENPRVPAREELTAALRETDCHEILLDEEQSTIYLPQKDMTMDLGGIAKGYATDRAVQALRKLGVKNAVINAGGNVYVLGGKADGGRWKVGVQDPRNPQGIALVLEASDASLVSSGDYQRYFEVDGVRYHHILDPATGYPARASAGTTIIAKSSTIADILSTACFIKGPQKGIELAESLPEVNAALVIDGDGELFKTSELNNYLVQK